jgi:hypothetical protein
LVGRHDVREAVRLQAIPDGLSYLRVCGIVSRRTKRVFPRVEGALHRNPGHESEICASRSSGGEGMPAPHPDR